MQSGQSTWKRVAIAACGLAAGLMILAAWELTRSSNDLAADHAPSRRGSGEPTASASSIGLSVVPIPSRVPGPRDVEQPKPERDAMAQPVDESVLAEAFTESARRKNLDDLRARYAEMGRLCETAHPDDIDRMHDEVKRLTKAYFERLGEHRRSLDPSDWRPLTGETPEVATGDADTIRLTRSRKSSPGHEYFDLDRAAYAGLFAIRTERESLTSDPVYEACTQLDTLEITIATLERSFKGD